MSLVHGRPSQGKQRGRPRSKSAPAILRSPKKIQKWKQWPEESMEKALDSGVSVKRAACGHGVPRQTLRDWVSGKVIHGTKSGPKPYLSPVEEKELANYLVNVAKAGYGKSWSQIKGLVEAVVREKATLTKKKISDGWFRRFMERQPSTNIPGITAPSDTAPLMSEPKSISLSTGSMVHTPGLYSSSPVSTSVAPGTPPHLYGSMSPSLNTYCVLWYDIHWISML